jgi:hypothetical protein
MMDMLQAVAIQISYNQEKLKPNRRCGAVDKCGRVNNDYNNSTVFFVLKEYIDGIKLAPLLLL